MRAKIITLAILLVVGFSTVEAKSKKKAVKKAAVEVKVDTVSVDVFSYALGLAQINGLKPYLAQRMGVDTVACMNDFIKGIKEVFEKGGDKSLAAYSAGLQIGDQVANQFVPSLNHRITDKDTTFINEALYKQGFIDALTNNFTTMNLDSANNVANRQMAFYHEDLMMKKYGDNKIAGEKFLAENAKKDSVKTLPSGVQYKELVKGDGPIPTADQKVKVNYEGWTIDGNVFDSSYKRKKPATFACSQVIPGWTEALTHMTVGSTWEIYIPQELAYGDREQSNIKPYSALIFKVELISIEEDKK